MTLASSTILRAQTTLVPLVAGKRPDSGTTATIYLDGAIKGGDDSKAANAASGSLGINVRGRSYTFSGQIAVAAKLDTIKNAFGPALLVPSSGKPLRSGLVEWRRPLRAFFGNRMANRNQILHDDRLQIRAYGTVSSETWLLPAVGTVAADTVGIVPVGYGVGASYLVAKGTLKDKDVAVSADLGFIQRILHGDGAASEFDAQRVAALGTTKTSFSGYEAALNLQYGKLTAGLTFYSFPKAVSVRGFSRGQVTAGFAIKADLLEGVLN